MKYLTILLLLSGCGVGCWTANANHACPSITDFVVADASDNGLLSDIYHIGRRGRGEAQKRGEDAAPFKLMMSVALIVMGSTMLLESFEKKHGGRGR